MSKPIHEETYTYHGTKASIEIFKEKLIFHGSWTCKECKESNHCIGASKSLDVTLTTSKGGFEKHTNQSHTTTVL